MPAAPTKGTTISFSNTPQAKDDSYSFNEGIEGSVISLDVMANDAGGNAKSLYSVDDGINSGGTSGDLLAADAVGAASFSRLGARIWIAANGKIAYDTSTLGDLDYLAAGESIVDTLTYAIKLGNGTLSWATVSVTLTGTNDGPFVVSADSAGAVTEDASEPQLSDSGAIAFDDLDLSDTHLVAISADTGNNLGGTLTASVTDTATGVDDGTVTWTYTIDNAATQSLGADDTATETFTITIDDQHGGTVDQQVTVTVQGVNDGPAISAADDAGAVTEDANAPQLSDSGVITFDDLDLSDSHVVSTAADSGNALGGTLTADIIDAATGAGDGTVTWSYSVDNAATQSLGADDAATETFTITIDDQHGGTVDQQVTVTVQGVNDGPAINAADDAGAVTEDAGNPTLSDSGAVSFDDVDLSDDHVVSVRAASGNTLGGLLTAIVSTAATGAGAGEVTWTYTIDNSATQSLGEGKTVTEDFVITIDDQHGGTIEQTVTVTVIGKADLGSTPPVFTGAGDPNDFDGLTVTATGSGPTNGNDRLNGTTGNNNISLLNGDDTYAAGAGEDMVRGQNGNDLLYGQAGHDTLSGLGNNDVLYGGSGNDDLSGENGNDTLYGGSGADTITGGNGDDHIRGGFGADNLTGDTGSDRFVFSDLRDTGDTVTDFAAGVGGDVLDLLALDAIAGGGDDAFTVSTSGLTAHSLYYVQQGVDVIVQVDTDGNAATAELQIVLQNVLAANLTVANFVL